MNPSPLVVGITGSTRSGKSWVAKLLAKRLGMPRGGIVEQDSFWCRAVRVRTPEGEELISEEEPDCTDHGAFAAAIQHAAENPENASCGAGEGITGGRGCVIAEGFQLLHDERVPRLLDHVFFLELGREDCIARRSAPRGALNPNPMSKKKCEALVWPAHERYVEEKVRPLGGRVNWMKAPTSPEEAAALVDAICDVISKGPYQPPPEEAAPVALEGSTGAGDVAPPMGEVPSWSTPKAKDAVRSPSRKGGAGFLSRFNCCSTLG